MGASGLCRSFHANASSISRAVFALSTCSCKPSVRAAASTSRKVVSAATLPGFTRTAMRRAWGTSWCRSCNRLASNSLANILIPVRLPLGRARLVTRPSRVGSSPTRKTMGIVVVAALAATAAGPSAGDDHGSLPGQLARHLRQTIDSTFGPAVADRDVLTLDESDLFQALAECGKTRCHAIRRSAVEKPDHRHRRLLRARRSGQTAAAPPSRVMKSRRLMSLPYLG